MEVQENTEQASEENVVPAEPDMNDPAVRAVLTIHQALNMARQVIRDKLTGVQAKAVLEAILEHPLEKEAPKFTTDDAHHVFYLADVITTNKFTLFQISLEQQVEKEVANSENSMVGSNNEQSN